VGKTDVIDYDERHFASVANSESGDVGSGTTFHYRQRDDIVWATYQGGAVAFGTLIARVQRDGSLDMRYQHVTADGAIKTGRCLSRPEILVDGRIRLHERWQWTENGTETGESVIEEVDQSNSES
jgi:hypothetical protein